jgi:hypothetical protein
MCIEALVVRGAILMSRFLQGEESDSFAWLNPSGFIGSSAKVSCDLRPAGVCGFGSRPAGGAGWW